MMRYLFFCFALLSFHAAGSVANIERNLQRELNQAQRDYKASLAAISAKRAPLLKQAELWELKLNQLRKKMTGQLRNQDEQYLGLDQLQARLEQWQEQNHYIHNVLSELNGHQLEPNQATLTQLERLTTRLNPKWHASRAIKPSGQFIAGQSLTLGPMVWFKDNEKNWFIADPHTQPTELTIAIPAPHNHSESWPLIRADITLGRATRLEAKQLSLWQRLSRGGVWIYPILFFGVAAASIALFKLTQYLRLAKLQPITSMHARPQDGKHWQQQLLALAQQYQPLNEDHLYQQLHSWKAKLEQGMSVLSATAAVAPLLGLLGTVSGMIQTFEMMNLFGNKDQSLLSGGISEALITTEVGLIVAIPSLLMHAYLNRRHRVYLSQLENDAQWLISQQEARHVYHP